MSNSSAPDAQYNSNGTNYSIGNGNALFRLNADGTFDTTFTKPTSLIYTGAGSNSQNGGNNTALIILDDDSIVVAPSTSEIVKFPADGATTPSQTITLNSYASVIRKTSDNKIFAVGAFSTIAGVSISRMVRLNSDLTRDTSFAVTTGLTAGTTPTITGLEVQSDQKAFIAGSFTSVNSSSRNYITRQYQDGTTTGALDTGYLPTVTNLAFSSEYSRTGIQSDNKILDSSDQALGTLTYNGTSIGGGALYRINTDSSLDTSFTSLAPNSRVYSFAQLNDGKILFASLASTLGGVSVTNFYKLSTMLDIPDLERQIEHGIH